MPSSVNFGSTALIGPSLLYAQQLTQSAQNKKQKPDNPPKHTFPTTHPEDIFQLVSAQQQEKFNNTAQNIHFSGSESKDRDAMLRTSRILANPKATEEEKAEARADMVAVHKAHKKASSVGFLAETLTTGITALKGAAITPLHPVAGPSVVVGAPVAGKKAGDYVTNAVYDAFLSTENYPSPNKARYAVVNYFLENRLTKSFFSKGMKFHLSLDDNGLPYTWDNEGHRHAIVGLTKEQVKDIQKRYKYATDNKYKDGLKEHEWDISSEVQKKYYKKT